MSRFLRYLACLVTLMFVGNALAAGYDCSVYKKYTSCNSGYYISNCGTSGWTGQTISSGSLTVGNSCKACPSGYKCSGGLVCPKANTVTCSAGYYLAANATSCSACGGNNYYCPGGTYTPSSSAQGRKTVSSGYYSTGGTSTTRTGQAICEAGYYCASGVRNSCSGSLQYQNEKGKTSCKSVSVGYYKSSNTAQAQCDAGYRNIAATSRNECVGSFTKTGSQVNGSVPTNCSSVTSWNSCTPGTCTYTKKYSGTIVSNCTPTNCTKTPAAVKAKANSYVSGTSCKTCSSFSSTYTKSDGGSISNAYCYTTKTKTGSQVNGAVPTNCNSVTSWNSCTPGTCTYRDYYSATDTTCTPTNCTKTADTTTGKAGYYGYSNGNGQACSSCSSFNASYPSSDNGAANSSACYKTCSNQSITNGTNVPNSTKVYYPNSCTYSPSCNGGYYLSNGQCVDCGSGYYCVAGSNTRVACSSTLPSSAPTPSQITTLSNGSWTDHKHAASKNDCICDWYFSDETRIQYLNQRTCYLGPGGINYTRYQWCRTGYYASDPLNFNSWYNSCSACTNKPANSTYTGYSTPSTMYAVENNCPWQCNDGYYKDGNTCKECGGNNYYCKGGTRYTVSAGYYSTGGTSTTRTGQSQCTGATYCSGGVKSNCPSGYTANTTAGKTAASACQISVSAGKYIATANSATQSTCTAGYACPGGLVNYGSTGKRTQCTGATYAGSGASSCSNCPSGYDDDTTAGKTAASSCKISVAGGKYIKTANSATQTTCSAGTYKAAHTVSYGSTSSCSACTGRTKYSAAGASACSTVSSGYYTTGCNTSNDNCTGQSQCTGATYCSSGVKNNCPSGYDDNTTAGKTAASSCQISCAGGTYVVTANAACTSVGTGYYKAAHTVNYGSTSTRSACPSGYDDGAAASAQSGCKISVAGGKYIKTANSATQSTCSAGTYKAAHTVSYGSTSSCSVCGNNQYSNAGAGTCVACDTADGYGNSGTSAASHAGVSSCKVTCDAGEYVPTAAGGCVSVGSGYYTSSSVTVAQNATSSRSACSALSGASPSGGTYSSVSPYNASTTCRYKAPTKTISGCSSVTSNTMSYSGTAWPASTYSVSANAGYYIANNNTASATCTQCTSGYYCTGGTAARQSCSSLASGFYPNSAAGSDAASDCYTDSLSGKYVATANATSATTCPNWTYKGSHTVKYGSTSSCSACIDVDSGWSKASGTGWTSYSSCKETRAATSISSYCSSGQLTKTQSSASAWGTATVSATFQADPGAYVTGSGASSSCSRCTSGYYCTGGTAARQSCSSLASGFYPNSAAGSDAASDCYTDSLSGKYVATANATSATTCPNWTYKGSHTVKYGSTSSCSACIDVDSGWSKASGTGWTSYSSCKETRAATSISSYCSSGQLTKTQSSASAWGTATVSATFQADPGAYVTGSGASSSCSRCGANDYCAGGTAAAKDCPSGYPNSAAGSSLITQCYSNTKSRAWTGSQTACTKPTGCYSVTCNACSDEACSYVAYSNSTGTGDGTIKSGCSTNNASCQQTVNTVTANAGRYVSGKTCPVCSVGTYQGTNGATVTSCSVCSGNTYAASEGMSACSSCPSGYSISGTTAANHDAKSDCRISCAAGTQVVTADAACTTPADSWYSAAHTVPAGSTSGTNVKDCLTNYYTPDTTTRTDHDSSTDCKISCSAGTRIVSANATSCTTPSGNWYIGAHSVSQGSTSSVNSCLANYTISGTAATNHDAASDCKITCSGGSYIATANNTSCSPVGAGFWAAASTVSQGSAGLRNACADGLTTIGSGSGADEAGDCGRVLNFNGEKVYLRSDKKTTPSLNVSISGKTFYGNMGTGVDGALKIKSGSTTYSVYDDSME